MELQVLRGHECGLLLAMFTPDGSRVLTVSAARNPWSDPGLRGEPPPIQVDPGIQTRKGDFGQSGAGAADSHFGGEEKLARMWDVQTGKELCAFRKNRPAPLQFGYVWKPTMAAFSPDGKQVAIGFAEKGAAVWDANSGGTERLAFAPRVGSVLAVIFKGNEIVETVGVDGTECRGIGSMGNASQGIGK